LVLYAKFKFQHLTLNLNFIVENMLNYMGQSSVRTIKNIRNTN